MKTLVFIVFLIVVLLMSNTTIEGASTTNESIINIKQPPYALSYIRKFTYNYTGIIPPIVDSVNDMQLDTNVLNRLQVFVGIIDRRDASTPVLKSLIASTKNAIISKAIVDLKKNFSTAVTINPPIWITNKEHFNRFITSTKITDIRIIMSMYDLMDKTWDEADGKVRAFTFSIFKELKTTDKEPIRAQYIRRATNTPRI